LFVVAATAAQAAAQAAARGGMTRGVANAALAQAAKTAPVTAIDYDQDRCDDRTVARWLTDLAGDEVRSIVWTGGPCELVGPGIDAGSRWCAQARLALVHRLDRGDRPTIEVFFEAPVRGRPGKPYAFRGAMRAADGLDMARFRQDFEADWLSRFPASRAAIVDCPGQ
jgi:hypothetical protein